MKQTVTNEAIRRRPGGSIDTAFYLARAHEIRSRGAHRSIARFNRLIRTVWTDLVYRLRA